MTKLPLRTIALVLFCVSLAGAAQAQSCPSTHYPCGNGSCCSR